MHRFYLPPAQCAEPTLFLTGREAHHALHVLRLRPGERVVVLDGAGHQLDCEIQAHDRDKLKLTVVEKHFAPPAPCQVTLLQAIPKGKLLEAIIQKATELGASRIVPLITERVVVQLDPRDAPQKSAKWQLVAIEAVKQCGAAWLPQVDPPQTPADFLAHNEEFDLPLVASLQPSSRHPREYFQAYQAAHGRLPQSASVWIGPEGDFTANEIRAISAGGALPITLGPLVLRTDTAALYCLSFVRYETQG